MFFLLKTLSAGHGLLWFHMKFRIIRPSSVENVMDILTGIVLTL